MKRLKSLIVSVSFCSGLGIACSIPAAEKNIDLQATVLFLKQEIAALPKSNSRPIDAVMAKYEDKTGFVVTRADIQEKKPLIKPQDVSDQDWKLFLDFVAPDIAEENDQLDGSISSYTLVDLDEDGRRDVIINTYIGGTGLFSSIDFARFDQTQGFMREVINADEERVNSYSINGRGGDQAIYYLRIDGVSYIAYRDSIYNKDLLTINRPFFSKNESLSQSAIVVNYRHQHRAILPQESSGSDLSPEMKLLQSDSKLLAAANQQLSRLKFNAAGAQLISNAAKRCPLPKSYSLAEGEEDTWPWRDAGHYTFDFVADMRVKMPNACYSASIIAYKSSYQSSEEYCCSLWLYSAPGAQAMTLDLKSSREWVRVETQDLASTQPEH
jgi:hypothetical protein